METTQATKRGETKMAQLLINRTPKLAFRHKIDVLTEEVVKIERLLEDNRFGAATRNYLLGKKDAFETCIRFLSI